MLPADSTTPPITSGRGRTIIRTSLNRWATLGSQPTDTLRNVDRARMRTHQPAEGINSARLIAPVLSPRAAPVFDSAPRSPPDSDGMTPAILRPAREWWDNRGQMGPLFAAAPSGRSRAPAGVVLKLCSLDRWCCVVTGRSAGEHSAEVTGIEDSMGLGRPVRPSLE